MSGPDFGSIKEEVLRVGFRNLHVLKDPAELKDLDWSCPTSLFAQLKKILISVGQIGPSVPRIFPPGVLQPQVS